ncbi:hypothetical protein AG1IA_02755 [Rhizoctonia solani AG-1 IA]|uniref:Uncharacterized protein n=1 Tax=Thanatephorus cucumeris (strain AG1-IA) TaxID=983506 RepID=L8X2F8_THACA|nr:hypothetical protein AG1IA_02755 [Rhizoctonia solani AG-1 IA]
MYLSVSYIIRLRVYGTTTFHGSFGLAGPEAFPHQIQYYRRLWMECDANEIKATSRLASAVVITSSNSMALGSIPIISSYGTCNIPEYSK